jgi:hypothetical protein
MYPIRDGDYYCCSELSPSWLPVLRVAYAVHRKFAVHSWCDVIWVG